MSEAVIRIDGNPVPITGAGIYLWHDTEDGRDFLTIDLWADSLDESEHFLAINGFSVAGCKTLADLQGRSFVHDGTDAGDPHGSTAAGELMESVMGATDTEPYMFQSLSLRFGRLVDGHMPVELSALVFDFERSGIPVEGSFTVKLERCE